MKIKFALIITILLIITKGFSQQKDRRAVFRPDGEIKDLAVSPTGKIWLVTTHANMYSANDIDSSWHISAQYFPDSLKGLDHDQLVQLTFFNKDTAILTGYITANLREKSEKGAGYYITRDGGRHWQLKNLIIGRWSYITSAYADSHGNVWLTDGGSGIYFSSDFGQHFQEQIPLFKQSGSNYLFMRDCDNGISGALNNEIVITHNNWASSVNIETPFDQGKYGDKEKADERAQKIIKIQGWKNYWVVNQNGHVFYSDTAKIDWKPFSTQMTTFDVSLETGKLFAATDNLYLFTFNSPAEFYKTSEQRTKAPVFSMKAVGPVLYFMTRISGSYLDEVYAVKNKKIIHCGLYTADTKIEKPYILSEGKHLQWGATGTDLYIEDAQGWYRQASVDFEISSIYLLNDSNVVLWDGKENNYLYNLHDHTLSSYQYKFPLSGFMTSPIQKMDIYMIARLTSSSVSYQKVAYDRDKCGQLNTGKTILYASKRKRYRSSKRQRIVYRNNISVRLIDTALTHVNAKISTALSIEDFRISRRDKMRYMKKINKHFSRKIYQNDEDGRTKKIYMAMPFILDTMPVSTLKRMLENKKEIEPYRLIYLVNLQGDSLFIKHAGNVNTSWILEYRKQCFASSSRELTKFINACMPKQFNRYKMEGVRALQQLAYRYCQFRANELE